MRAGPAGAVGAAAALVLLAVLAAAASFAAAEGENAGATDAASLRVAEAQLGRGRDAYDFHCTTCHGATGAGFAEARSAFPADHDQCSRCHGPGNPAVMTPRQIQQTQTVFSLGHAPALDASSGLDRFGRADALHAYVRTAMPRWDPGRLDAAAYVDVVVYVLSLAYDVRTGGEELTAEDLARIRLSPLDGTGAAATGP